MNGTVAFLTGLGLTVTMTSLALIYLRQHLRTILIELCGTEERARFWTAFSNVTLFLTPLIFALRIQPENGTTTTLVYQMSDQISFALVGLVVAIGIVGIVVGRFIARERIGAVRQGQTAGAAQMKTGQV